MDRTLEDCTLRLAVERGLLTAAEVERFEARSVETGELRVDLLLRAGRLSPDTVASLAQAARLLGEASTDPDPDATMRRSAAGSDPEDGPPAPAFPVPQWERYEVRGFVGRGGMGQVFEAWDPRLERPVALKFLRGDDPDLVVRFRREAQAQARVDHENVCRIYEVGEVDSHPYIAMQLIDGRPLHVAAREMTLEQKLRVMRDVALALHAAHRAGLVHRDVKPGNILVDHTEEHGWKPYVLDFGLARPSQRPELTMTGEALGTPHYMAPEQANGQIDRIDRRTDVYGLGATLYEVLTGRPPFAGEQTREVLRKAVHELPPSFRQVGCPAPRDVESVTMKCLRKNPDERYASARALAEDLDRYLDGQPVSARPTTLFHRLELRVKRNRSAFAIGAAATVLLAVSLGWGLHNRWSAAQRSRIAQTFGQDVERIGALARHSAMAPRHDVRATEQVIRERMGQMQDRMTELGDAAAGPGHYALGRAYQSIGSLERARTHLEAAWNAGYREPAAAFALGVVLGDLYERALDEVAHISGRQAREAARAEIARTLRDPAVTYLRASEGAEVGSPSYLEGLLALHEERYEEALDSARRAIAERPWLYEARQLEGDVLLARAQLRGHQGDHEGALGLFREARSVYEDAARIAPSSVSAYRDLTALATAMMMQEINGPGGDVTPHFEFGREALHAGREVNPDDARLHLVESGLYRRLGTHLRTLGQGSREALEQSRDAARRGVESTGTAAAHRQLGASHRELATLALAEGHDPKPSFEAAVAAYAQASRLAPANVFHSSVGLLYKAYGRYQIEIGEDPTRSLAMSIEAHSLALELDPDGVAAHHNLGVAHYTLADYEASHGRNPSATLAQSISYYEKALAIDATQLASLYNLGRACQHLGAYRTGVGEDGRPSLEKAIDAFGRAIAAHPESSYLPYLLDGLGTAWTTLADLDRREGRDPRPSFDRAVREYELAIEANPGYLHANNNLGYLHVARAQFEWDSGRDPLPAIESAITYSRLAIGIKPTHAYAHVNLGDALRLRGATAPSREKAVAAFSESEGAFAEADRLNPEISFSHRGQGRLSVARAHAAIRDGDDPSPFFESGEASFRTAIGLDEDDADAHVELGRLLSGWAEVSGSGRGDPSRALAACHAALAQAFELNPRCAEIGALRASLLLTAAATLPASDARSVRQQARDHLDRALDRNPNLRTRYAPERARLEESIARSR